MKRRDKKDNKGREESWTWEETPEVLEALKKLAKASEKTQQRYGNFYPPSD